MCVFSPPSLPPPPPIPAPPATEVNAGETKLRDKAPQAPQSATGTPASAYRKKGKASLRVPLEQNLLTGQTGVNIP